MLSLQRSRVQSHWGAKIPQAEAQKKKKKAKRQVTCSSTGYLASRFVLTSSQRSLSQLLYWDLFVKSFFF